MYKTIVGKCAAYCTYFAHTYFTYKVAPNEVTMKMPSRLMHLSTAFPFEKNFHFSLLTFSLCPLKILCVFSCFVMRVERKKIPGKYHRKEKYKVKREKKMRKRNSKQFVSLGH